jgi:hypothetical protein
MDCGNSLTPATGAGAVKLNANPIWNEWNESAVSSWPTSNFNSFQFFDFVNQLERITGYFPLCSGLFSRYRVRHPFLPERPLY